MKKNAMLKIAAILMVAVLLTTCAISSTFAKYVTTDSTSSSARVAKWGVIVDASTADTAFAKTYKDDDGNVVVKADTWVIAPGTQNLNAVSVSITGTPEVACDVAFSKDTDTEFFQLVGNWGTKALPVIFHITVGSTTYDITGTASQINALAKEKLDAAFAAISYTPGTSAALNTNVVIGWEWAYGVVDNEETPDVDEAAERDEIDTYLGDAVANATTENPAPAIAINFAVSVTQVGENWAIMA